MELAVNCMKTRPDFLIIDAVKLKLDIPQKAVPKLTKTQFQLLQPQFWLKSQGTE